MKDRILSPTRQILTIQAYNGNWNYDPYMHGLYNGLEMALSFQENRPPVFREPPNKWSNRAARWNQPIIKLLTKLDKFIRKFEHNELTRDANI